MLDVVTGSEADRPWWAAPLRAFVATALTYGPLTEAAKVAFLGRTFDWSEALIRSLGFGIAYGLLVFGLERFAPIKARRRARRVLVTGVLPPDATSAEWRPFLDAERRGLRFSQVALLVLLALIVVLSAVAAARAAGGSWAIWLYVGAITGAAGWTLAWLNRRLAVINRFLAELALRE